MVLYTRFTNDIISKMKKILFYIVLFCCVFIYGSCEKTQPEDAVDFKYEITMGDTLDLPSWYSLIDSVCYIPLKTDEKTVMGEVEQIIVKDDLIYILANGVYCFDLSGNIKFKIANRGRARNEFIEATTLSVSDGYLCLYDKMKGKEIYYDAYTGKYVEDVDVPVGGRKVYVFGDNLLFDDVQSGGRKYTRFKVYSKKRLNRVKAGYFSEKEHEGSIRGTISWSNDGIIYSSYLRNIAWKMNGKECVPYVKVIIPEDKRLSNKTINGMITDKMINTQGYNASEAIYGLSYLAECNSFITGRLTYSNSFLFFIYDKETGNARFFRTLPNIEPWQRIPVGECTTGEDKYMYSIVTSESLLFLKNLLGNVGVEPSEKMYREAYNVMNSVNIDDNPVVAKFKLKRL